MATASVAATASAASEMNTAFFYGTLMLPAILHRVIFGTHSITPPPHANITRAPAVLPHYIRHRVRHCDYPGITPCVDKSVRGVYVTGLTAQDVRRLDAFEGSEYERRTVEIQLLKDGKGGEKGMGKVMTETYVFLDKSDLEDKEWDFKEFKREKLMNWVGANHEYVEVDQAEANSTSESALSASKSSAENHDSTGDRGANSSSNS